MLSCFRRWSRTFSRRATAAPKPRSRPRLLALEDRVVPTNIGGAAYFAIATGPGVTTQVKVFSAANGVLVNTITSFGTNFKLGASVSFGSPVNFFSSRKLSLLVYLRPRTGLPPWSC